METIWSNVIILGSVKKENYLDKFLVQKGNETFELRATHGYMTEETKKFVINYVNQWVGKIVDMNVNEYPWEIKKKSGIIYFLIGVPRNPTERSNEMV